MYRNANDAYLESRVLSADPMELVSLLYQAALGAVRDARRHLAEGNIEARSRSISKACEAVIELTAALDRKQGGELADRLARLYDYVNSRLLEANLKQEDAPLAETLGLLTTLAEGWEGVVRALKRPEPPSNPWGQALPPEAAQGAQSHAWSL